MRFCAISCVVQVINFVVLLNPPVSDSMAKVAGTLQPARRVGRASASVDRPVWYLAARASPARLSAGALDRTARNGAWAHAAVCCGLQMSPRAGSGRSRGWSRAACLGKACADADAELELAAFTA